MQTASVHEHEVERLAAVAKLRVGEGGSDHRFDALTKEAVEKLHVKASHVALIEQTEEILISCSGDERRCGPRDISFCGHALLSEDVLIIEDTHTDKRFLDNPYVLGEPYVRFYAGMRLLDKQTGLPVGVFCVRDTHPRKLSIEEMGTFMDLAARAEQILQ